MCLESLQVFFGEATDAMARVYMRMDPPGDDAYTLHGSITGPQCAYAHTLEATLPLRDLGPGPSLLAEALIPEPCFWTPDRPNLYRLQIQLRGRERLVAAQSQMFGLRRLGASRRNLLFDAKRWVLRAVVTDKLAPEQLPAWRDAFAAAVLQNPGDSLCEAASRIGVLLVADLRSCTHGLITELARLARHAAVGMVIVPDRPERPNDLHSIAPNLVLAQHRTTTAETEFAPWVDVLVCDVDQPDALARKVAGVQLPVVAIRKAGPQDSVAAARGLCDHLQRDLAPYGDYAGYIV